MKAFVLVVDLFGLLHAPHGSRPQQLRLHQQLWSRRAAEKARRRKPQGLWFWEASIN